MDLFIQKEFQKIHDSTLRKTSVIKEILDLTYKKKLKIGKSLSWDFFGCWIEKIKDTLGCFFNS